MTTKKQIAAEIESILNLIEQNSRNAWENNMEETKVVTIREDFNGVVDEDGEFTQYNGWYERLEKLLLDLKKSEK